jgi:hypothetical protein
MVHLPAVNTPPFDWVRNKTGQRTKAPSPYVPDLRLGFGIKGLTRDSR